jgi:hypothetical protein
MRTTITLDDRIARALKNLAHRTGKPFKQVVNETLRTGLDASRAPAAEKPYRLKPASLGGPRPGVDLAKALQLAASLEDEEVVRKLRQRK